MPLETFIDAILHSSATNVLRSHASGRLPVRHILSIMHIIHIDCNAFFASCEVSLRPDLRGKPVVVANCNEAGGGVILALTKEAKALRLKRGDPVFKVKNVLNQHNVAVFPASHSKYSNISRQLMQAVREQDIVLNFTQYSVDEFFGALPLEDKDELKETASKVKAHIEQSTGIPVSCGLATTYTLAKVATWYAKHYNGYGGICVLPKEKVEVALKGMPITDLWGIGRRTAPRLVYLNINTALDLYSLDEHEVRRLLNINGVRTWKELHGIPAITIDRLSRQKSIVHSHTFAFMTSDKTQLHTYIADYAMAAARKLRDQHSVCQGVSVFLCTNRFREDLEQYDCFETEKLRVASADSIVITNAAAQALERIYLPGFQYKRAGVVLSDITSDEAIQLDLFSNDAPNLEKSRKLMSAVDSLTDRYGMGAIKLGSQQTDKPETDISNTQPPQANS